MKDAPGQDREAPGLKNAGERPYMASLKRESPKYKGSGRERDVIREARERVDSESWCKFGGPLTRRATVWFQMKSFNQQLGGPKR
jgi:hypothetical protein